jgi:hypothetical protein
MYEGYPTSSDKELYENILMQESPAMQHTIPPVILPSCDCPPSSAHHIKYSGQSWVSVSSPQKTFTNQKRPLHHHSLPSLDTSLAKIQPGPHIYGCRAGQTSSGQARTTSGKETRLREHSLASHVNVLSPSALHTDLQVSIWLCNFFSSFTLTLLKY